MSTYPKADKKPENKTKFDHQWTDDYSWLEKLGKNPEIRKLIDKEKLYFAEGYGESSPLFTEFYQELKDKIKEEDQDVPEKIDEYFYYSRTEKNKEYEIHCRKKDSLDNPEEVYFDENVWAKDFDFFELGALEINSTHKTAIVCLDTEGDEIYSAYLWQLDSQEKKSLGLTNISADIEWVNNNKAFYYVELDKTQRPFRVFRFDLESMKSEMIWEELDPEYFVGLSATKDEKYILIESHGSVSSESYTLDANTSDAVPLLFKKRTRGTEYYVGHHEGDWIILTNHSEENFALYQAKDIDRSDFSKWECVYSGTKSKYISDFEIFKKKLVIYERERATDKIVLFDWETKDTRFVSMPEQCYQLESGANSNYASEEFFYVYSSMTTAPKYLSHNFDNATEKLLKNFEVPKHYNVDDYQSSRVFVTTRDDQELPLSILWNKKYPLEKAKAVYLYAYGSYGYSLDCGFDRKILSLVDRGVVFINVHARGGADMGRSWYLDGKFLKKKNTFYDIIDATEYLGAKHPHLKNNICLSGGSAGGLTVGATINMRPELYALAILNVPFVDVINTMLDEEQALTALEYDEWGNPNDEEYFHYMKSYSPYDNIKQGAYPICLAIAGLHDQRVKYHEALKWVQKLRDNCEKPEEVYLYTNTSSGHGGSSGRYEYLKEIAMEYAFIVHKLGV